MSEEKLIESLEGFLGKGRDWERKSTNISGVFVLKLPSYRRSPSRLVVEVNPVDASGNPTKKRGLIIRSSEELEEFKELLREEKLEGLLRVMERVNPPVVEKPKPEEEVIEV